MPCVAAWAEPRDVSWLIETHWINGQEEVPWHNVQASGCVIQKTPWGWRWAAPASTTFLLLYPTGSYPGGGGGEGKNRVWLYTNRPKSMCPQLHPERESCGLCRFAFRRPHPLRQWHQCLQGVAWRCGQTDWTLLRSLEAGHRWGRTPQAAPSPSSAHRWRSSSQQQHNGSSLPGLML